MTRNGGWRKPPSIQARLRREIMTERQADHFDEWEGNEGHYVSLFCGRCKGDLGTASAALFCRNCETQLFNGVMRSGMMKQQWKLGFIGNNHIPFVFRREMGMAEKALSLLKTEIVLNTKYSKEEFYG